jgi:hypothetical protein
MVRYGKRVKSIATPAVPIATNKLFELEEREEGVWSKGNPFRPLSFFSILHFHVILEVKERESKIC